MNYVHTSLEIKGSYTQEENPLDNFYGPCLSKSKNYLRAAGYFRSTVLHLVPAYLNMAFEKIIK